MTFKAPPMDVCPNLEDLQTEVPEGYIVVEGECVPVCEYDPEIPADSENCQPPASSTVPPTEPPTVPPTVTEPPTTVEIPPPPTVTAPPTTVVVPTIATPAPSVTPAPVPEVGELPRTGGDSNSLVLAATLLIAVGSLLGGTAWYSRRRRVS
jgi:LPXTG-motif cell wall-anchored protein